MSLEILEPFPERAWPRVWVWAQPFRRQVLDDFGPQTLEEYVEQQLEAEQSPNRRSYGISFEGELGGLVTIDLRVPNDPTGCSHILLKRSFFGPKIAEPGVREIYRRVFESGVKLIRSEVFSDNNAIRSFAKRLGAVEYGLPGSKDKVAPIPNATMRNGELTGVVGLVLTQEDLDAASRNTDNRVNNLGRRGAGSRGAGGPKEEDHDDAELLAGSAGGSRFPGQPIPEPSRKSRSRSGVR